MSRNTVTSQLLRAITVRVLITGILLQPLLTYLVTPFMEEDGGGHLLVMCTLNGLEQGSADGLTRTGAMGDEQGCPALKLFQFAGSARVATPLYLPTAAFYLVEVVNDSSTHQYHSFHTSRYPTRAPPMS